MYRPDPSVTWRLPSSRTIFPWLITTRGLPRHSIPSKTLYSTACNLKNTRQVHLLINAIQALLALPSTVQAAKIDIRCCASWPRLSLYYLDPRSPDQHQIPQQCVLSGDTGLRFWQHWCWWQLQIGFHPSFLTPRETLSQEEKINPISGEVLSLGTLNPQFSHLPTIWKLVYISRHPLA